MDEFLVSKDEENIIPTGVSRDASTTGFLPYRRRKKQESEQEGDGMESHKALRESIVIARSRYESSPNKSQPNNSSDSDVSKGSKKKSFPERRFSNMNRNLYEGENQTAARLKMISEEDLQKDNKFLTENENQGPTVAQRRKKMMQLNVTTDIPKLSKAGTTMLDEADPARRHHHQRTPSSGKLASVSKLLKPEEFETTATVEYLLSNSPSKNQIAFRVAERDHEIQGKVVHLNSTIASLLRKKMRTGWACILMGSPLRKTSVRESTEKLRIDLKTIPSMTEETPRQQSAGRPKLPDTDRSVSFNVVDPTQNKEIEYNKVITVARLFIRLQQNAHVTAYHALTKMTKLIREDPDTEKEKKLQPTLSLIDKMTDRCLRGAMAKLRLSTLTDRLDLAASQNNGFKQTIAIGRLVHSLQRKQIIAVESLLRHAKYSIEQTAMTQENLRLKNYFFSKLFQAFTIKQSAAFMGLLARCLASHSNLSKRAALISLRLAFVTKQRLSLAKLSSQAFAIERKEHFAKLITSLRQKTIRRLFNSLGSKQVNVLIKLAAHGRHLSVKKGLVLRSMIRSQKMKIWNSYFGLISNFKQRQILDHCIARYSRSKHTILSKLVASSRLKQTTALSLLRFHSGKKRIQECAELEKANKLRLGCLMLIYRVKFKQDTALQTLRRIVLQRNLLRANSVGLDLRRRFLLCRIRLCQTSKQFTGLTKLRNWLSHQTVSDHKTALLNLKKSQTFNDLKRCSRNLMNKAFSRLQAWKTSCNQREVKLKELKSSLVERLVKAQKAKVSRCFYRGVNHWFRSKLSKCFMGMTRLIGSHFISESKRLAFSKLNKRSANIKILLGLSRLSERRVKRQCLSKLCSNSKKAQQKLEAISRLASSLQSVVAKSLKTKWSRLVRYAELLKARSSVCKAIVANLKAKRRQSYLQLLAVANSLDQKQEKRKFILGQALHRLKLLSDSRLKSNLKNTFQVLSSLSILNKKEETSKLRKRRLALSLLMLGVKFTQRLAFYRMCLQRPKTLDSGNQTEIEPLLTLAVEPQIMEEDGQLSVCLVDKDSVHGFASDTNIDQLPTDRNSYEGLHSFTDRLRHDSPCPETSRMASKMVETENPDFKDESTSTIYREVIDQSTDTHQSDKLAELEREKKETLLNMKQGCTILKFVLENKMSMAQHSTEDLIPAFAFIFVHAQTKKKMELRCKFEALSKRIEANVEAARSELAEIVFLQDSQNTLHKRQLMKVTILADSLASIQTMVDRKQRASLLRSFLSLAGRL